MDHEVQSFGKAATLDAEPSFAELQRRISEIPDGPSGILNTPKPYRMLNIIGGVGAIVALLPFVFVKLMTPAMWMVTMLHIGMAIMVVMWLPTKNGVRVRFLSKEGALPHFFAQTDRSMRNACRTWR